MHHPLPNPRPRLEPISLVSYGIPDRNPANWCRNCGHPESWHSGFLSFDSVEDTSSLLASPSRCFFTNEQGKLSAFCGCMHFKKPKSKKLPPRPSFAKGGTA